MSKYLAPISKALGAAAAAAAVLVGAGVLSGVSLTVANVLIAVAGSGVVGGATYLAPANKKT